MGERDGDLRKDVCFERAFKNRTGRMISVSRAKDGAADYQTKHSFDRFSARENSAHQKQPKNLASKMFLNT